MARDPIKSANRVLAALPNAVYERLGKHLEPVPLPVGTAVHEAGAAPKYLLFPTAGIVSLIQVAENGASTELAVVGSEGVVGCSTFLGGESMPSRAVVQSAGSAARLPVSALQIEFKRNGDFARHLLRYTQALITQMAQNAVCYRHHPIEKQLCRWLLAHLDRLPGSEVMMTQEMIASMLGVRREGITEAAGKLMDAGLIHYSRGRITVRDRAGLEKRACECYRVVSREYARLGFAGSA
jgi:CRP-like cAMP-binding protein